MTLIKYKQLLLPNEIYLALFKVTENRYLPKSSMSWKSATKASRGIPCDPYLVYRGSIQLQISLKEIGGDDHPMISIANLVELKSDFADAHAGQRQPLCLLVLLLLLLHNWVPGNLVSVSQFK